MKRLLAAWLAIAVPFLALDAVWLSVMAQRLYRPALGSLMRPDFDFAAAGLFYVLYFTGVAVFAVRAAASAREALWRGALFGLVAYGTYDLTNQATVVGWPWRITLADLAWGTFATAVAAAIAQRITSRSSRR